MSVDQNKVLAAAKAAYPELWPQGGLPDVTPEHRAGLAIARQEAMSRVGNALHAYNTVAGDTTQTVVLILPEDAAMVQQVISTTTYIDNEGRVAYAVKTVGEGSMSSWLGMTALQQNYLLNLHNFGSPDEEDEELGD